DLGQIRFEAPQGWSWDDAALAAADIPEGAVGLLTAKIARLPAGAASLLELASCVGDEFDLEALTELSGGGPEEVRPSVFILSDHGRLAPSAGGFRFVSDRIREAAHALLQPRERAALHRRVALQLLGASPPAQRAERTFEIADHLNRAREVLEGPERQTA